MRLAVAIVSLTSQALAVASGLQDSPSQTKAYLVQRPLQVNPLLGNTRGSSAFGHGYRHVDIGKINPIGS